jgi:hypothetical protein
MELSHAVWISIPEHSVLQCRVGMSRKQGARKPLSNGLDNALRDSPMEIYSSTNVR